MLKQQIFGAIGLMVVGFFYLVVVPIVNSIFVTAYNLPGIVKTTPSSGACGGILSQLQCVGNLFSNLDLLIEGMLTLILVIIFVYLIIAPWVADPSGYSL